MKPDEPIIVSSMPEFDALMSSARRSYRIASHRRHDVPAYRRIDARSRGRRGRRGRAVVPSRDSPRALRRASRRSSFPCMHTHARPLRRTGRSTRTNEEDGRLGLGRVVPWRTRARSAPACEARRTPRVARRRRGRAPLFSSPVVTRGVSILPYARTTRPLRTNERVEEAPRTPPRRQRRRRAYDGDDDDDGDIVVAVGTRWEILLCARHYVTLPPYITLHDIARDGTLLARATRRRRCLAPPFSPAQCVRRRRALRRNG
jgi:hypothetical protein